jgi:hypothetical protein
VNHDSILNLITIRETAATAQAEQLPPSRPNWPTSPSPATHCYS